MKNNYAFIDGANLHKGVDSLGWNLDYQKFFIWIKEKYKIKKVFIFLGYIDKYRNLYKLLERYGYIIIFKEVVYDIHGKAKGNCDADLVLHAVINYYEKYFEKVLLVSSDGDYSSLVKFLLKNNSLISIVSPANEKKCSILLKRTGAKISYIKDQYEKLRIKKAPDRDKTL